MKPNQWSALADVSASAPASQLDLLLAQRQTVFRQQHEVRKRLAALAAEKRELIERRILHELPWHVFWRRLRQGADAQHSEETEIVSTTDPLSPVEAPSAVTR